MRRGSARSGDHVKVIGRLAAAKAGLKFFYTGKACSKGHVAQRYTSSGTCVECQRQIGVEVRKVIQAGRLQRLREELDAAGGA